MATVHTDPSAAFDPKCFHSPAAVVIMQSIVADEPERVVAGMESPPASNECNKVIIPFRVDEKLNEHKMAQAPKTETNSQLTNWHFLRSLHQPTNGTATTVPKFAEYDATTFAADDDAFAFDGTTTHRHHFAKYLGQKFAPVTLANPHWNAKHFDRLAHLSCDSGEMILRLNFSEPFKGIVYPDHNRLSPCRFFGDGHLNYELRLPLRGCGTRQVAPRIFVNDVIVRFHKTLELEEDEVKTLICRYPPPAPAATDSMSTSADWLQVAGVNNAAAGRTPTRKGEIETNGSQFELIDQRQRQPVELRTTGNIETLSENLIVAPNGQHPLETGVSGGGGGGNLFDTYTYTNRPASGGSKNSNRLLNQQSGKLRDSQPDLFRQRNSFLNDPSESTMLGSGSGGGDATFNRTSGVNFLERMSSIELLFLISTLMFLVLLALGLAGSYLCFRRQNLNRRSTAQQQVSAILRRKRRFPGGSLGGVAVPPQLGQRLAANQTVPHCTNHYPQPIHQHYSIPAPKSTSSPESDASHQGLLANYQATSKTHHLPLPVYAGHPQSCQQPNHLLQSPEVAGYSIRSAYRDRQAPQAAIAPPMGTHRSQHVMGRREAANTYGYGYAQSALPRPSIVPGRQRHLSSHDPNLAYPVHQRPTTGRRVLPLGETAAEYARALKRRQVDGDYGSSDLRSANLWRAKSLASMTPGFDGAQAIDTSPNAQSMLVGGTLNRQEHRHKASRKPPGVSHNKHWLSHQRLADERNPFTSSEFVDFFCKTEGARKRERDNELGERSFSDGEDETNRLFTSKRYQPRMPEGPDLEAGGHVPQNKRLLLKSIEDSYITNFTEIYEQEYKALDTTEPLSFDEWRKLQPAKDVNTADKGRKSEPSSDEDERGDKIYHSTNLRSLTELDVDDFAKTLTSNSQLDKLDVAGSPPAVDSQRKEFDSSTLLRPASGADRLLEIAIKSPPKEPVSPESGTTKPMTALATTTVKVNAEKEDDDLIVSPDYECQPATSSGVTIRTGVETSKEQQTDRSRQISLKLERSRSPASESHNSVSYV